MSARKNSYAPPPAPPEPPPPARLTLQEIKETGEFFKGLLENTKLTKWIILAGVGGLCELIRIVIDVVKIGLQMSNRH